MTDLNTLSNALLVAAYNTLTSKVVEGDVPAFVKKFSDKKTAVRRVADLLDRVNGTDGGGKTYEVTGAGEIAEAGAPQEQSTEEQPTEGVGTSIADHEAEDGSAGASLQDPDRVVEGTIVNEPTPTEPTPTEAAATETKKKGRRGQGRPPVVSGTDIITLLHKGANPKRSTAADRFALYRSGMTIQEYMDGVGERKQALRDLAWDTSKGWIKITGARQAAKEAEGEVETPADKETPSEETPSEETPSEEPSNQEAGSGTEQPSSTEEV